MNDVLKSLLDTTTEKKSEEIGNTAIKKRGKEKVKYVKINDKNFRAQLTALAKVESDIIEKSKDEYGDIIVEIFECYIKDLMRRAYNEKTSFCIKFLGTTLNVDYYDERLAKNPLTSEVLTVPPKVQLKLLSDRYDEENLEILLNKPKSMNSNIKRKTDG